MIQLIQANPDKTAREAKVKENLRVGVDIEQTKNMKSLAIQALPQVAISWTGICVTLEMQSFWKAILRMLTQVDAHQPYIRN